MELKRATYLLVGTCWRDYFVRNDLCGGEILGLLHTAFVLMNDGVLRPKLRLIQVEVSLRPRRAKRCSKTSDGD